MFPKRPQRSSTGPSLGIKLVIFLCATALGVIVMAYVLVRAGVQYLETLRPPPGPPPTAAPVIIGAQPRVSLPSPSPSPEPSPSVPTIARVRVTNTGGSGANIRANPSASAPVVRQVADGTVLEVIGQDQASEGRFWRNVREPAGGAGWIASELVQSVP